jgi:Leucine-rich repeat (LRR) protein
VAGAGRGDLALEYKSNSRVALLFLWETLGKATASGYHIVASQEKRPTCDSAMGGLYSKRAARDDLHANICDLPVELKALVLSHIEHVKTRQILALSSTTFREAFSLPGALPRTFDFEGVAGDLADHLVHLLDDDRVRSLDKERVLELIGVHQDRLCEYACERRNFKVLKWARNELNLPWADVLVLRMLRETWPALKWWWRVDVAPESWRGVTMVDGRVVKLELKNYDLTGAVPADIGLLTSLESLWLYGTQLTSLPAEIGQLTALKELYLFSNQLTSVPAEIGQLTSLRVLYLHYNQLTSLPAEIGQLTALKELWLYSNELTSVPAEIGQLASLRVLRLGYNQLTSVPAAIREFRAAGCKVNLDYGVTVDE